MHTLAHGRARVGAEIGTVELVDESLDRRSRRAMWCLPSARLYLVVFSLVVFEKLAKRCVGRIVNPLGAGPIQPACLGEIIDKLVARSKKEVLSCLLESGRDVLFYKFVRRIFVWESRHGYVAVLVYAGRDIEA